MLVVNAGLTPVLVEVPGLGVSATAIESLECVSAISKGVTGVAFFGGLPRFFPPTGRLLVISFLGAMILEEMKGSRGNFTPLNGLSLGNNARCLRYRPICVCPCSRHVDPVVITRAGLGELR